MCDPVTSLNVVISTIEWRGKKVVLNVLRIFGSIPELSVQNPVDLDI